MAVTYERAELSREVAGVLVRARKTRGWTLSRAADEIGCSLSTVHCWENSKRCPSVAMAGSVARVYQLDREPVIALMGEAVANAGRSKPSKRKAKAAA